MLNLQNETFMGRIGTISLLTVIVALIAVLVEFLLPQLMPGHSTKAHMAVLLYFWAFYAIAVVSLPEMKVTKGTAGVFMLFKAAKMVLSLFALLLTAFFMRSHAKTVMICFLLYYLLMLLPESVCLMRLKKHTF